MPADLSSSVHNRADRATEASSVRFNPSVLPPASWRSGVLCGLLVVTVVLACGLAGEIGFNDDWSYGRTAELFAQTGHFVYNGWAAPTEGWLIVWAAPFIRIFGFSYLLIRLCLLPIVFATIFLFHQSLLRFGLTQRHASLGALTLGLSPIFLPPASGFMTDIPALMVTVLCLLLCQIAVAQKEDRRVILWLAVAALTNLVGGTVRQTAFLGILLMIPAVGWWQRGRRGVLTATAIMTAIGCVWIFLFLKWYHAQPHSTPSVISLPSFTVQALEFPLRQIFADSLVVLGALSPAIACNLAAIVYLPRRGFWGFYACFSALVLLASRHLARILVGASHVDFGISPGFAFVSALIGLALLLLVLVLRRRSARHAEEHAAAPPSLRSQSWQSIFWLLGPFSLGYFALMLLICLTLPVWDRYLLELLPIAIVCLLKTSQDRVQRIPSVAILALALMACAGFAETSGLHSEGRAVLKAANILRADNVPRTEIEAGFAYSGETQLDAVGYMNSPDKTAPLGTYRPYLPPPWLPSWVLSSRAYLPFTPVVVPRYFLVMEPDPDLVPSKYPPVEYTTVTPPFHRFIYIEQLPGVSAHQSASPGEYPCPNSGSTGFSNIDASRVTIVNPDGVTK
jgi:hypothetical protein